MIRVSYWLVAGILSLLGCAPAVAHEPVTRARTPVQIPDIPGYVTLKCDFHMHTVFSDGLVWPTVRVEEAWRQGLDAISITDHIEYQPHKADVSTNHNRSVDIARGAGSDLDILVVRGSEITRQMPPGHLNAIFLTNSSLLAVSNWWDAVKAAHDQGAFIFWNHPGWEAQITNKIVRWYDEHTRLLDGGMLHGIEVVNGRDYYPEAHLWAVENKLTMLSNSDVHNPLNMDYHVHNGDHRPLTLVFARERTAQALKEALVARRTAVYSDRLLVGDESLLRPLFDESIFTKNPKLTLRGKGRVSVQIHNRSEIDYVLERSSELDEVSVPEKLTLAGGKTVVLDVRGKSATLRGTQKVNLPYRVANLLVGPNRPLRTEIPLEITFVPAPAR